MGYNCRVCGSSSLFEVLDMGEMPLAGDFRSIGEVNELFSLAIDGCQNCGVLQVRETVEMSLLFGDFYCYASSTIPSLVTHFKTYAQSMFEHLDQKAGLKLLEIGCNDGVFLEPLAQLGFDVVGVDASENIAAIAQEKGLDVQVGFFGKEKAQNMLDQYGEFDVITCSNMFAHNPEVNDIIEAVDTLLTPEGEFWIEVHSAHMLFEGLQWDCFYHEHCFYWTIEALEKCLAKHGFKLRHYKTTSMHGGALRAAFCKNRVIEAIPTPVITPSDWRGFGNKCLKSRELIRSSINKLPVNYAYGAAGRAVTLINWAQLQDSLDFVVDGSPLRFGKVIPNTSIPIISEEEFFSQSGVNEWCFVTAHNYLDSIRQKVDMAFPLKNIKYIVPLPYVSIK